MDNYATFRSEIEKIVEEDDDDYTSSLDENASNSEYSSSESNDGYEYQEGELCVCCDDKPADRYCQLEDGEFYCTDCYESQKDWD